MSRGEFEILYGGARGGGKTDAGLAWLSRHIEHPDYRFLVVRRNSEDLSDWLDRARVFYKRFGGEVVGKPAVIKFPSGAIGRTGHLKDEAAYTKYIGHEYHRMLIEELTLIKSEEAYLKLISSARSTVPGLQPRVFATTNPGNAGHIWVKNRFVNNGANKPYKDPESGRYRIYIPSKVTDNPTLMLNDPGYIQYLNSLPEKLRRAWRDGDWDVFEGQFFAEWDEAVHVCEPFEIPETWPKFRAMDWGYSDPFCCLWFAAGPDNRIYVYREFYRNRLTDSEYAQAISSLTGEERINYSVADPGSFWVKNPDTGVPRFETFARNGVSLVKADNSRINGWGRIREYLQVKETDEGPKAAVQVFNTCTNLIRTLPNLVHHERKVEDIADGMEDHAPDAFRYGLQSRQPHFRTEKKFRNNFQAALYESERKKRRGR